MKDTLRVGVVGVGFVAEVAHLPFLKAIPFVEIAGIADVDCRRANRMGERFNIARVYSSPDELLNDPTVDVIDICTPPHSHAELAQAAAEHGKQVIVEKPMAVTLNEALAMRETVRKAGTRLGVVLNLRYSPCVRHALQVINSGAIGELKHVSATIHTFAPTAPWVTHPAIARHGVLFDFFPHVIDLITWITQSLPCRVECKTTTADANGGFHVQVELEAIAGQRCLALIDAMWTTSTSVRVVEFYGTERNLLLDLQDQFCLLTRGYVTPVGRVRELLGRSAAVARRLAGGRTSFLYGSMVYLRNLLLDSLGAFRRSESPAISMLDGLFHTAVLDAAVRSAEGNREIEIDWNRIL
jgi:predicted dehydrogenase